MSNITTNIVLVFILNTQPIAHLQLVDGGYSDVETCQKVISTVAYQEREKPEDEQIAPYLRCIKLSVRNNPDGDGPSKPVKPSNSSPMFKSNSSEDVPCKADGSRLCRDASYKQ